MSHPSADGPSAVVNQLFIGTVTRDFYGSRLECRAQGSKLLPPVVKEITVQVHCEFCKINLIVAPLADRLLKGGVKCFSSLEFNKTFQFSFLSLFSPPLVKPIKVKIVTPNELLTAGRPTPIRCETWGSYPPAKVMWLMDGEAIRQGDITVNSEGAEANLTSSILTLRVSAENDGAELTCRSTNPWFSNGALEDKRRISVACSYIF